jgi:heptosyltransferase I
MVANSDMHILIIKLSAIGDVVHSLPVLSGLKTLYPQSHIHWLIEETASGLIQDHPLLDKVLICHRKRWVRDLGRGKSAPLREFWDFLSLVRENRYDLILDLQNLFKSAFWVALARGDRKLGFSNTKELAYIPLNERIGSEDFSLHAVDRYLKFIKYLGDYSEQPQFPVPVTKAHMVRADQLLKDAGFSGKRVVALHPVALWPTKLWSQESFKELAKYLTYELGAGVIFTGGVQDKDYIDTIAKQISPAPINLCGRVNLLELAALFSRCAVLISTDTGPMHLAAAMGIPVVALFGPTAPDRTGPYGAGHVVVRAGLPCSPCFKKKCDDPRCMSEIMPNQVFQAVKERLKSALQ